MKKDRMNKWLSGDYDLLEHVMDTTEVPDHGREQVKKEKKSLLERLNQEARTYTVIEAEQRGFRRLYNVVAVISCIFLISVLLFLVSLLPHYGEENPRTIPMVERYVEEGLEETGAVNIVSGLILDYRAFDTLGESHVLFTALVCVMILLRIDRKNMRTDFEDYYTIQQDAYYDLSKDSIIRFVGSVLLPVVFIYGIYILLNGQNSPGGGFSGGAVMGAALIMSAAAFGFKTVDRYLTAKASSVITFVALGFYSFAKGYVFFTGANGLDNHIPKGTPGAIFSGGLILPLDIAVGIVVACTMFGFYSLFVRGIIGGEYETDSLVEKSRSASLVRKGGSHKDPAVDEDGRPITRLRKVARPENPLENAGPEDLVCDEDGRPVARLMKMTGPRQEGRQEDEDD